MGQMGQLMSKGGRGWMQNSKPDAGCWSLGRGVWAHAVPMDMYITLPTATTVPLYWAMYEVSK